MRRTVRRKLCDTRELMRQARTGAVTRRELLTMFGVSAAAIGAGGAITAAARPLAYDYVIVGAGSAGCTLAARLLADSQASVLLIEAGGSNDRPDVRDFTRSESLTAPGSTADWPFESEPQPALLG
ncbi:MAG TPA: lycopene cyclase family protein, partial [Pseudonocardia sp.]